MLGRFPLQGHFFNFENAFLVMTVYPVSVVCRNETTCPVGTLCSDLSLSRMICAITLFVLRAQFVQFTRFTHGSSSKIELNRTSLFYRGSFFC